MSPSNYEKKWWRFFGLSILSMFLLPKSGAFLGGRILFTLIGLAFFSFAFALKYLGYLHRWYEIVLATKNVDRVSIYRFLRNIALILRPSPKDPFLGKS